MEEKEQNFEVLTKRSVMKMKNTMQMKTINIKNKINSRKVTLLLTL